MNITKETFSIELDKFIERIFLLPEVHRIMIRGEVLEKGEERTVFIRNDAERS